MKINGTTVRGGWSTKYVYGTIDGRKFQLSAKDSFETKISKVRSLKKKIESGKVVLPATGELFYVMPDESIVAI